MSLPITEPSVAGPARGGTGRALDARGSGSAHTAVAHDVSPGLRAAALLAFALLFAFLDVLLALLVHAALGEAGGWVYRTGTLVHFVGSVLLGGVLAIPHARAPSRGAALAISAGAAGLLLTLHAAAYQIHAEGGHLPTLSGLTLAASAGGGAAMLARCLGAGALGVVALYVFAPRLAKRLEARTATPGGRLADLVTIALFGTIWLGTAAGAEGPLYYGATPPVVHLAFGDPQAEVDAPAMTEARHVHAHRHDHDHEGGAHHVHTHAAAAELPLDPPPPDGIPRPTPDLRALLQQLLQSDPPRTVPDPSYPFCRGDRLDPARVARKSVVLVDVSGTAARDAASGEGALARLAASAPSFREVRAPGQRAIDGLAAAISGVPALVELAPLRRIALPPFPRLPSLAADLREAGFRTAAFDSRYLGEDDRGALLRLLGFERVDGAPLAPRSGATGGAGSRADVDTADAFAAWARAQRRADPDAPFLALVALDADPVAGAAGREAALERLLAWHAAGEAERGTLLVVFSDHAPGAEGEDARTARFEVPLVIAGLSEQAATRARTFVARAGGLHDLPQTVLALLGSDFRGCHQGVDLLQPADRWPDRRVTLSFFGARQETLVAHDGDHVWIVPREGDRASLFNVVEDAARADDLWAESDSDWAQMKELRQAYLGVMAYLRGYDRFLPPAQPAPGDAGARPAPTAPVRVAALGFGGDALSPEERIDAAVHAGFDRVRVEVAVGADGIPVLVTADGRPPVPLSPVLARYGRRIGLELVLAFRATQDGGIGEGDALAAVLAAARSARGASVRLTTVDGGLAAAAALASDLPVGLELGPLRAGVDWLDFARAIGADFVTVSPRDASDGTVQRARNRGLEVQLEPRDGAAPAPGAAAIPDAITESAIPAG